MVYTVIAVSWSPDGKHVAYLTQGGAVCVTNSRVELQHSFELPSQLGDLTENLHGKCFTSDYKMTYPWTTILSFCPGQTNILLLTVGLRCPDFACNAVFVIV